MDYDFTKEFPAPKEALSRIDEIVNRHSSVLISGQFRPPTIDDEVELLVPLMGLGRLIEINLRAAWQAFALAEGLGDDSPSAYDAVLKLLVKNFTNEPLHYLFRRADIITGGLVHGDFYQAFVMTRRAYDRDDLGLKQDAFQYQRFFEVTLTKDGLNLDVRTGQATTSKGKPSPSRAYILLKNGTYESNSEAFYVSGVFIFVYDILKTAFQRAFHFRKCIASAIESA